MSEAVDEIMIQAQVFASAWSLVGGRFDTGHCSDDAKEAKLELEKMVRAAIAAAPAQPVAEPAEVSAVESNTAGAAIAAGAVYAELPMQFACSGVFPVYSADQMRAFADGTHALRTKSEASREFLERMLSAMEGVIDVADRKTAEFDALRSCVVDLTLMLFKPEALRSSRGKAPAQQPAPSAAPAVVSEREFKQFLSDVMTAAGLVTHGKQCKDLGSRLGAMCMRLRSPAPQADSQPAPVLAYPPLPDLDGTLWLAIGQHRRAITNFETTLAVKAVDTAVHGLLRAYVDADRAARAPADSVLEDAARYQWIRGPGEESTRYSRWLIEYWDGPNGWQPMQRERMDSAIDAAIAAQQGDSHE